MLEVRQVSRHFGGLPALDKVSFHVTRGSVTALIGPNGAGKTTMINCITGVDRPSSGRILFNNQNITGLPPFAIARLGVSRTFQNLRLFNRLTVLDNVLCGLTVQGGRSLLGALLRPPRVRNRERRLRLKAMAALDQFGLADQADWPVSVLAYGDRKRVELARAVVRDPQILLLDEPVAGLNSQETNVVGYEIRRLRAQGYTLMIVEHDMDLVMKVSDRIVVLDGGRCIAVGTPDEVTHNPLVLEAYLGRASATA
ncbi:MAG: ABC transporter ATP-binding protein [Deltaproteobacteria bacterium]|jgi:branched-chain amino acid transport system ATP-binding protein|nr:ABC transporter ATP-binding protein [Deltaproteobacteria bacterium]MBW2519816.1 ABC transporter ATP-binding protein [Deltaproteobacteria bacterium]